jgi:SAM-dependent methyltransferase
VGSGYDVVLISHVLEHLVNPQPLLEKVHYVLAPDGILAVALPNVVTYRNRIKLLLGRFEYTKRGIMDETHVRFYTFETGRRLLERHGYNIILSRAAGGFPLSRLRQVLIPDARWAVDRVACTWLPGLFGFQSIYLARSLMTNQ